MVHLHRDLLSRYFVIDFTENPDENPLYNATNLCADELNQCVDKVTNLNELPKLLVASKYPFVKLTRKANVATILSKAREPVVVHTTSCSPQFSFIFFHLPSY